MNRSHLGRRPSSRARRLSLLLGLACLGGCVGERADERLANEPPPRVQPAEDNRPDRIGEPRVDAGLETARGHEARGEATSTGPGEAREGDRPAGSAAAPTATDDADSLATLLLNDATRELLDRGPDVAALANLPPEIDDEVAAKMGIRRIDGKHLTLYTDAPPRVALDQIPEVFDAAVPQWCAYFGIATEKVADWKMVGYHIVAKERHQQAGLLPANLPPFLNGYHRGSEFWAYEQPSDYYRRHLVLHEGVHGLMTTFLGGTGPPWYREGMAEYLATHTWKDHRLVVATYPASKEEVPYWGRIKVIQDEFAAGRGMMPHEIMRYDRSAHLRQEPYAWCWAAVAFLDNHPIYRNRFRQLIGKVTDSTVFFTRDFESSLKDRKRELDEEWQIFVINIDYGYDFVRNMIKYAPGVRARARVKR